MNRIRFLAALFVLIGTLLSGCQREKHTLPTTPSLSDAIIAQPSPSPLLSSTPTAAPKPSPSISLTPLPPTLTPTPIEPPPAVTPAFQRPAFDDADPTQLQIIAQWSTGAIESHYLWSPDGSRLLLVSAPVVRLIDAQTFQQLWEAPGGTDGAFSGDGSRVRIQDGSTTRLYNAADGQPDRSGQPFLAAVLTPMIPPVKSFTENFDPHAAHQFSWLSMAIQEDGSHREMRFFDAHDGCPQTVYTDLPPGISGYSFSPDNRLLLIAAQGIGTERNYQAVILGINSGFEPPLPAHSQDPAQPDFHPTRPNLGVPQRLPVLYSPIAGHPQYPPPIAQPGAPVEAYHLKPWSESDGLAMLKPLVEYATANDVFGPASGRSSFYRAQEPLRVAALEYFQRFPQSTDRAAVQWRLALSNSIMSNNATDAWIAAQLEAALNQQGLTLDPLSLNAALAPFGFSVDTSPFPPLKTPHFFDYFMDAAACDANALPPHRLLAHNLFGDGKPGQVLIVKTIGSPVGMVIAVHQDDGGQYHVAPVAGQWALESGELQEIDVVDITGDGRPEIRVDTYYHSGSMMASSTGFYQWQGSSPTAGRFVELTGGIYFDTEFHPPELEIIGATSAPKTLVAHKHGILVFDAIETFKWDGERFVSSTRIPFPLLADDPQEAYLDALTNHQYDELITQIHTLPTNPWRTFLLGYIEALQFHPGHARAALQPVADYDKAVAAFLAVYQNGADLYRACQAALQIDPVAPCGTDLAMQSLIEHLGGQPTGDLPKTLEGYGLRFAYQASLDANNDGRTDWLLVDGGTPSKQLAAYDPQVWLVLSNASGYEIRDLNMHVVSESGPYALTSLQLPDGKSGKPVQAFLLKQGSYALIFRVHQSHAAWRVERLLEDWGMSSYQEKEENGSVQLLIFHNTQNFDPPEIARWEPAAERFEVSDYLEYLLLVEGRADEAQRVIPTLLAQVTANPGEDGGALAEYGPRLQYLLGLTYELSGDTENAVRTYYNLWQSHPIPAPDYMGHPDQPYAIMAREKLERLGQ